MSLFALCPNFSLSFTRFLNENGRAYTLLCAALLSRICFCTSDSSLQKSVNGGEVLLVKFIFKFEKKLAVSFLGKKGGFCELLSKPHSLMFDHQKGPTFISFGSCASFHSKGKKNSAALNIMWQQNMTIKSQVCPQLHQTNYY